MIQARSLTAQAQHPNHIHLGGLRGVPSTKTAGLPVLSKIVHLTRQPFDAGFLAGAGLSALLFNWLAWAAYRPLVVAGDGRAHYNTAASIALLHGRLDVPSSFLGGECFILKGRCYGYYGITPALLRFPLVLLGARSPSHFPELLFFGLGFVTVAAGAWWVARQLVGIWAPEMGPRLLAAIGVVSALLGLGASPLLFLASLPLMYEEAILWAVGFACVALGAAISIWLKPKAWTVVVLVVADALAMSARPTVGGSAIFVTAVLRIHMLGDRRAWGSWLMLGAVAALATSPVLFYAKFGSLSPPYKDQVSVRNNPARLAIYHHFGGLNLAVLPTNLFSDLRPDSLHVLGRSPFVALGETKPLLVWPATAGSIDVSEPFASITDTMPLSAAMTVIALVGTIRRFIGRKKEFGGRRRSPTDVTTTDVTTTVIVSALGALALDLVFPGQSYRYVADWLPLFFLAVPIGLVIVAGAQASLRRWAVPVVALLVLGFGAQLFIQVGLAVENGLTAEYLHGPTCHVPHDPFGTLGEIFCPR